MVTTAPAAELDTRLAIVQSILSTPHRKFEDYIPLHKAAWDRDPLFTAHMAVWAQANSEVRDHKVIFVAGLLTAPFDEFREAGYVLLQSMAPYEVARVNQCAKVHFGKVPRVMKSAIVAYLRGLELSPKRFDTAAMRGRKALKSLYASLHVKPSERANGILFLDKRPADSAAAAVQTLATLTDPEAIALHIVEHKIPYPSDSLVSPNPLVITNPRAMFVATPRATNFLVPTDSDPENTNNVAMFNGPGNNIYIGSLELAVPHLLDFFTWLSSGEVITTTSITGSLTQDSGQTWQPAPGFVSSTMLSGTAVTAYLGNQRQVAGYTYAVSFSVTTSFNRIMTCRLPYLNCPL